MLTPAQIELRRGGIAASEVAAVLGLSPWAKPIDVYCRKVGLAESEEETPAMRRGRIMEPAVAAIYAEMTGVRLAMPGEVWPEAVDGTVRHPSIPWALATPDRVVLSDSGKPLRLVEIKSVSPHAAGEWGPGSDEVPDYYRVQCEWQMEVCSMPCCDLVPWIAGEDEPRIYSLAHRPSLAKRLLEGATRFWERVERRDPPPPDGSPGWRSYLAARHPVDTGEELVADGEDERWASLYASAQRAQHEAEETLALAEAHLKGRMGEASVLRGRDWRASWRRARSGGVDWKAVALALGADAEIVTKHSRPGTRRFVFQAGVD